MQNNNAERNQTFIPTLQQVYEDYIRDRRDLRPTTVISYNEVIKRAGDLLNVPIDQLKYSDFKHLYSELRYDKNYKPASIELLNNILSPALELAVKDDIISKNPAKGAYKEVARGSEWRSHHKNALSKDSQKAFLQYVHGSPVYRRWENFFVFLFGTGVRIGEAIALRWEDISFVEKSIKISRSLYYAGGKYFEGPPKTEAGIRTIPMLPEVGDALKNEYEISKLTRASNREYIPGEKGTVFLNSKGSMLYASTVNNAIRNIVNSYNRDNPEKTIDNFSVHQIRHSFCTRLCEQDVNLKVVQSVMGHSNFETTMNIYAEVSDIKKQAVFDDLKGKIV